VKTGPESFQLRQSYLQSRTFDTPSYELNDRWAGEARTGYSAPGVGGADEAGAPVGPESVWPTLELLANPVRGGRLGFRLVGPKGAEWQLTFFDVSGRQLQTVRGGPLSEPTQEFFVELSPSVPSGVAFARMEIAGRTTNRVLQVVR